MASIVSIDDDSENSVIEIEPPRKPPPLVIDLADEEVVINVKPEVPKTSLFPGITWISQYDSETGDSKIYRLDGDDLVEDETLSDYEEANDEYDGKSENENDEKNVEEKDDEVVEDENKENNESNENENEKTDDVNGGNDGGTEEANGVKDKENEKPKDTNEDYKNNEENDVKEGEENGGKTESDNNSVAKNDDDKQGEDSNDKTEQNDDNRPDDQVTEDDETRQDDETKEDDQTTEDDDTRQGDETKEDDQTTEDDDTRQGDETKEDDQTTEDDETRQGDENTQDDETRQDDQTTEDDETRQDDQTKQDDGTRQDDQTAQDDETRQDDQTAQDDETRQDDQTKQDDGTTQDDRTNQDNKNKQDDQTGQEDKGGKNGESGKDDQTTQNDDSGHNGKGKNQTTQGDENREDNRNQPGPSSFDPLDTFSWPSNDSQTVYQRSSYSPPPFHNSPYSPPSQPKKDDIKADHPDHWTPEMVKFYDEDWGNENDFDVDKLLREMDQDPALWQISSRDVAYWKNRTMKSVRCYNCLDCGHESYDCTEEKKDPSCHMCGHKGHIAYNCPQAVCLNCGTDTTGYVIKCKNCKFGMDQYCERCRLTGHIYPECTDHWRLYHSTTGTKRVLIPQKNIYKAPRNRWCCNCGRRGHLQFECGYCVKNSDFSDTLPFVSSYVKAFTRGSQLAYGCEEPDGPKRLKINEEDNIMTNPRQAQMFERKTSHLRNRLRSLKRNAMRNERPLYMGRRQRGPNRFSYY